MTITITYPFTTPSNYTYDTDKVEITGGKASLKATPSAQTDDETYTTPGDYAVSDAAKIEVSGGQAQLVLIDAPATHDFSEDFADDTDFTYDNTKAEFSGGQVQQKLTDIANETLYANYNVDEDANRSDGSATGTFIGSGASVSAGKLNCAGTGAVSYVGTTNISVAYEVGAVRFKVTPNYSGTPVTNRGLMAWSDGSLNNMMSIQHLSGTGNIEVRAYTSAGVNIYTLNLGAWSPTASQEYEFEFNWKFTAPGAHRLFIDGVQHGSTNNTVSSSRTNSISLIHVGAYYISAAHYDGKFDDVQIFDAVQHTTDFAGEVPRTVPLNYVSTEVELPQFVHGPPEPGSIQSLVNFVTSESGTPKYTISSEGGTHQYWNGAAWVDSNGTYAQANTETEMNTNITTLNVTDTFTVDVTIYFTDSETQSAVADLEIDHIDQQYATDNPYVTPTASLDESALEAGVGAWTSFTVSETKTGSDEIKYILSYDDGSSYYYWTGSAWAASNGTYAQSNTGADVNTNIGTFPVTNSTLKIRAFLHSNDGTTQPTLQNIEVGWNTVGALNKTDPTVVFNSKFRTDLLCSFTETSTKPNNAEVKYILAKDGVDYYHNGSSWTASNGTYSQSNTAAEVNTNAATFTTQDIAGVEVEITAFLHTDTDVDDPELDTVAVCYDFTGDAEDTISTCTVFGYVNDTEETALTEDIIIDMVPAVVEYKDNVIVKNETITVTPNTDGYFEVDLIENDNMAGVAYYKFKMNGTVLSRTVPNASSKAFNTLAPLR